MQRRHGDTVYSIPGNGLIPTASASAALDALAQPQNVPSDTAPAPLDASSGIISDLMLKGAHGATFPPDALAELADRMVDDVKKRDTSQPTVPLEDPQLDNPNVTAGYTYLGQFINHDLTFDPTQGLPPGDFTPQQIQQGRRPSLDLSCLYGTGPGTPSYRRLYETALPRFIVGKTFPTAADDTPTEFSKPNDLPREGQGAQFPRRAVVADSRNDDNLAVAQTHVAFLRFHNAVVDHINADTPGLSFGQLFEAARREVVLCYQRIIRDDFLPKMVDPDVYQEVKNNPLQFFRVTSPSDLFLPLEFASAAFRVGHSMVRNTYNWNRIFQPHDPSTPAADIARLPQLFDFTGNGTMPPGFQTLPTTWIIDWRRFYDFSGVAAGPLPPPNASRMMDTRLALFLHSIPLRQDGKPVEQGGQQQRINLVLLDLLAGNKQGLPALPSGQEAAQLLGVPLPLTAAEIAGGTDGDVLRKFGLDVQTPLWYYILKEAELRGGGEHLGPVGSRIVAETLFGIMRFSQPFSILRGDENLPAFQKIIRMADLLNFALGQDINPLGD